MDDMMTRFKQEEDHVQMLHKLFKRLKKYKLCLNPNKCVFGAKSGKLLGFVVSYRGIEIDPSKIKAIYDLKTPTTVKEVRSLLRRLNYIARSSISFLRLLNHSSNC